MARKKTNGIGYEKRVQAMIPAHMEEAIRSVHEKMRRSSPKGVVSHNEAVRRILEEGIHIHSHGSAEKSVIVHGSAPCGQWREAVSETTVMNFGDLFDHLGLKLGDFGIVSDGDSMKSEQCDSIESGSLIVFRPNISPLGKIVLARATTGDGVCLWTIKKWSWTQRGFSLKDGRRRRIELPPDAVAIAAIGVCVTVLPQPKT